MSGANLVAVLYVLVVVSHARSVGGVGRVGFLILQARVRRRGAVRVAVLHRRVVIVFLTAARLQPLATLVLLVLVVAEVAAGVLVVRAAAGHTAAAPAAAVILAVGSRLVNRTCAAQLSEVKQCSTRFMTHHSHLPSTLPGPSYSPLLRPSVPASSAEPY